jgi:hypothetical protein
MRNRFILLVTATVISFAGFAESGPSTWAELEFSKKIVKNLKIEFNPELRLLNDYKMDAYILEGGFSYKVHKYLSLATYYRYEKEWDYKKSTGAYKGQIELNRLAFDAKTGFSIDRFNFAFRLRYTKSIFNDTSDDEKSFFRYRAKVEYDIKNCKFIPYFSIEAFHDLDSKEITKYRYTTGLDYTINSKNEVGLFYRLQDYTETDKASINIIGIGYNFKF